MRIRLTSMYFSPLSTECSSNLRQYTNHQFSCVRRVRTTEKINLRYRSSRYFQVDRQVLPFRALPRQRYISFHEFTLDRIPKIKSVQRYQHITPLREFLASVLLNNLFREVSLESHQDLLYLLQEKHPLLNFLVFLSQANLRDIEIIFK